MAIEKTSNVFQAKYPGWCAPCKTHYDVDEDIIRDGDGYVHAVCGLADTEPARNRVCTRCWLERANSGECGCDD